MKKYGLVLLLILVIGFTAGCLGGNGSTTTSSPTASPQMEHTSSTTTTTSVPGTTTTHPPTEGPRGTTTETLLAEVSGIKQFTYTSSAEVSMLVTVKQANLTQRDNVTLAITETGYIDFESWSAGMNITTKIAPHRPPAASSRVIIRNVTYIRTPMGWTKATDPAAAGFVWRYNLVSLARKYLQRTPNERENGEKLVLRYRLDDGDVRALATMYLTTTGNTVVTVKGGILELYFEAGRLVGGRLSFSATIKTSIDDPTIGKMTITQDGSWSETVTITSVNEKRKVEEPST
ncbi:hypothetical protein [Thermococcus sp. 21S7]|uniref:hypothetical protein n=1 Tax=Thermococcus sp. 21S7 TaxID=1638221 RepID=UPI0014395D10|nr:hypothetical protein [Thermococcus sp. 21S7]NJE61907.1 hypothetical protein [Thermococcus sp. 21S7]